MEKKTRYILVLVIAVLACGAYSGFFLLTQQAAYTGTPDAITIGTTPDELSTLIWVAEERGFFAKNGLNVTVKTYATGLSLGEGARFVITVPGGKWRKCGKDAL